MRLLELLEAKQEPSHQLARKVVDLLQDNFDIVFPAPEIVAPQRGKYGAPASVVWNVILPIENVEMQDVYAERVEHFLQTHVKQFADTFSKQEFGHLDGTKRIWTFEKEIKQGKFRPGQGMNDRSTVDTTLDTAIVAVGPIRERGKNMFQVGVRGQDQKSSKFT